MPRRPKYSSPASPVVSLPPVFKGLSTPPTVARFPTAPRGGSARLGRSSPTSAVGGAVPRGKTTGPVPTERGGKAPSKAAATTAAAGQAAPAPRKNAGKQRKEPTPDNEVSSAAVATTGSNVSSPTSGNPPRSAVVAAAAGQQQRATTAQPSGSSSSSCAVAVARTQKKNGGGRDDNDAASKASQQRRRNNGTGGSGNGKSKNDNKKPSRQQQQQRQRQRGSVLAGAAAAAAAPTATPADAVSQSPRPHNQKPPRRQGNNHNDHHRSSNNHRPTMSSGEWDGAGGPDATTRLSAVTSYSAGSASSACPSVSAPSTAAPTPVLRPATAAAALVGEHPLVITNPPLMMLHDPAIVSLVSGSGEVALALPPPQHQRGGSGRAGRGKAAAASLAAQRATNAPTGKTQRGHGRGQNPPSNTNSNSKKTRNDSRDGKEDDGSDADDDASLGRKGLRVSAPEFRPSPASSATGHSSAVFSPTAFYGFLAGGCREGVAVTPPPVSAVAASSITDGQQQRQNIRALHFPHAGMPILEGSGASAVSSSLSCPASPVGVAVVGSEHANGRLHPRPSPATAAAAAMTPTGTGRNGSGAMMMAVPPIHPFSPPNRLSATSGSSSGSGVGARPDLFPSSPPGARPPPAAQLHYRDAGFPAFPSSPSTHTRTPAAATGGAATTTAAATESNNRSNGSVHSGGTARSPTGHTPGCAAAAGGMAVHPANFMPHAASRQLSVSVDALRSGASSSSPIMHMHSNTHRHNNHHHHRGSGSGTNNSRHMGSPVLGATTTSTTSATRNDTDNVRHTRVTVPDNLSEDCMYDLLEAGDDTDSFPASPSAVLYFESAAAASVHARSAPTVAVATAAGTKGPRTRGNSPVCASEGGGSGSASLLPLRPRLGSEATVGTGEDEEDDEYLLPPPPSDMGPDWDTVSTSTSHVGGPYNSQRPGGGYWYLDHGGTHAAAAGLGAWPAAPTWAWFPGGGAADDYSLPPPPHPTGAGGGAPPFDFLDEDGDMTDYEQYWEINSSAYEQDSLDEAQAEWIEDQLRATENPEGFFPF